MKVPILFIVFNRIDTVKKVFERIKEIKPSKLYVAADGARSEIKNEKEKCDEVRSYILNNIDWDCEVKTLFRNENKGCKLAPASAINWFFENEEMGIILEDDCLFSPSFITFCEELLVKYRNDERVMMISGDNFQDGIKRGDGSYYFQRIAHCWGWASWARAWKLYDINMKTLPLFIEQEKLKDIFPHPSIQWYWTKNLTRTYKNILNTSWDYQWDYAMFVNNGLCIMPNVNLVQNIGISDNSTHTNFKDVNSYSVKCEELENIIHPSFVIPDYEAELYEHKNHFKINLSITKANLRKVFQQDKIKI